MAEQSSISAQHSSLSAHAASLSSAIAAETSVAGANARSASAAAASASAAASVADLAASSVSSAQSSLSSVGASLTAQASSVSASSAAVASSASAVADRSVAIDAASSSLDQKVDSITKSFAQVSSQLDKSHADIASSTSALGISFAAVQSTAEAQATVAAALAASAADVASQTAIIGSVTASLAAAATASGIATACKNGKYYGNGHCYETCPAAYPVPFDRAGTFNLCCTQGAQECINASNVGATVCSDGFLLTVLDQAELSGTCTRTCSTTSDDGLTKYEYLQLGGVYPECVAPADCEHSADPASKLCCPAGVATCVDQTTKGALSCTGSNYFTPIDSAAQTGTCAATCLGETPFYTTDRHCLASCTTPAAYFLADTKKTCCPDANAASCEDDTKSVTCNPDFVLDTANGACVAKGACPNGAKDNGLVCCPDGALSCSSATTASACGTNAAGRQTYFTQDSACVEIQGCRWLDGAQQIPSGSGSVVNGHGYCCSDVQATACISEAFGQATQCPDPWILKENTRGGGVGKCLYYCHDRTSQQLYPLETVGAQSGKCVDNCESGASYTKAITLTFPGFSVTNPEERCCPFNAAACSDAGVTTCQDDFFLQPDGQSCQAGCPAGSVQSADGHFCCEAGVASCSDVGPGSAVTCQTNFFLLDADCVASCPSGLVENPTTGECDCAGANVQTCTSSGGIIACKTGFEVFTPADDTEPPSCQAACPAGSAFDASSASAGTCKCTAAHVAKCDASGPLQCVDVYALFQQISAALPYPHLGPVQCVPACPDGTSFDYGSDDGACQCDIGQGEAACDLATGYVTACDSTHYLDGSGASATCTASPTCPYGSALTADKKSCTCTADFATSCDATGAVTACKGGYHLITPNGVASCSPLCGDGYSISTPTSTMSCASNCRTISGLDAAKSYASPDSVAVTSAAGCRAFCTGPGAGTQAYAVFPRTSGSVVGGQSTDLTCACFDYVATDRDSYGADVDTTLCDVLGADGRPAGSAANGVGSLYVLWVE